MIPSGPGPGQQAGKVGPQGGNPKPCKTRDFSIGKRKNASFAKKVTKLGELCQTFFRWDHDV